MVPPPTTTTKQPFRYPPVVHFVRKKQRSGPVSSSSASSSTVDLQPEYGERLQLRITNVTTTAWLGVTVDLTHISEALKCKYDKKLFPNCVYQSKWPKCTILIYESGKVVTIGTSTPEYALTAIFYLVLKLQTKLFDLMWDIGVYNFHVVNYVGSFSTGFALDLLLISQHHRLKGKAKYNKNHFPAARYKTNPPLPKTTLAVFRSGRVNIAGAKTPEELSTVYNSLNNMRDYRI